MVADGFEREFNPMRERVGETVYILIGLCVQRINRIIGSRYS